MALTKQQLEDAALTLENDSAFYREYTSAPGRPRTYTGARTLIRSHLARICNIMTGETAVNDREALREYFDKRYAITDRTGANEAHASFDLYEDAAPSRPTVSSPTTTEPTMAAPFLQTKTFLNGADIALLTTDQVVDAISAKEDRIATLSALKNQPRIVKAEIASCQADIDALVKYLDDKTPA